MVNLELIKLIEKYKISNEDLIELSRIEEEKKKLSFFKRGDLSRQSEKILKEKYNLTKMLDRGSLWHQISKQEINESNVNEIITNENPISEVPMEKGVIYEVKNKGRMAVNLGTAGWLLQATETGLKASRTGAAFKLLGSTDKAISYRNISSIEINKRSFQNQYDIILVVNSKEEEFQDAIKEEAYEFQRIVQEQIEKLSGGGTVIQQESLPDQIKKLHDLKELGILTEQEFEQKKAELLSKM